MRSVLSAQAGCCDQSKATSAEAQEIRENRIWVTYVTNALWTLDASCGPNALASEMKTVAPQADSRRK